MGFIEGHEQRQVYIAKELWPELVVLAKKLDLPIYKVINAAIQEKLDKHFTAQERKALKSLLSPAADKKTNGVAGRRTKSR